MGKKGGKQNQVNSMNWIVAANTLFPSGKYKNSETITYKLLSFVTGFFPLLKQDWNIWEQEYEELGVD